MANTNVFTGSDATLTLAIEDSPEGQEANEVIEFYNLSPVGRATNVEVRVETDIDVFHEIGKRHPELGRLRLVVKLPEQAPAGTEMATETAAT